MNTENDARRGHSLYPTAAELASIPTLYATEPTPTDDKLVVLHYFCASADWWLVELDPISWVGFGYANLGNPNDAEWGYVALDELAGLLVFGAFPVERDLYWTPTRFGDIDTQAGR